VKPSYGLSDGEIETMLRDSMEYAENDRDARRLREEQVEADRVLEALEAALAEDGKLLNSEERAPIDQAAAVLSEARKGNDPQAIKQALDELDKAATVFVSRRMDTNIQKALSGHRVDEFSE
jgi:molecular chaperone HscA